MCTIDVIIPTWLPDARLVRTLQMLQKQTQPVRQVILINTDRKRFFERLPDEDIVSRFPFVRVQHIAKRDFDHGGTRRRAAKASDAEYLLFMTQDAVPYDETLVEALLRALTEDKQAYAAYARQLPREGAAPEEAFERSFNYPEEDRTQTADDIATRGIKAFYCSNVCAMYRKEAYDALGGFAERAIFNEDVYLAQKAIRAGYHIRYVAAARVIHSHGYTCMEQLRRNFDQGVSQAMYREAFADVPPEGEGMRLVRACTRSLLQTGHLARIPYFYVKCAFRLIGYKLGRAYEKLPAGVCRKLAMNRSFFGE